LDDAFRSLNRVEADFSTYLEDSQISRIGRGILAPDDATPDVRHVLSRCAELEEATGSRFSIRPGRPGGPGLDPAGFVKGWSVDEAALGLRVLGLGRFTIDAGGDVLCAGMAPGGRRWRIGIRHPDAPDDLGVVLMIRDGAVATSGTYFRGDHIWGRRPTDRDVTSVTVVGPSLGVADALATAIYGDQAGELSWLSRFPEYGVLLMTADLQARWTDRLDGVVAPAKSADALSEGETHAPARVSERL
jgi:thiamine biosynthesis lipoprotein